MKIQIKDKLNFIKENWPLFISIAALLILVSVILILSLGQNDGNLVYALDDPYIHMAMAKNFAEHGVWGVTKYGFTSSTSSPLYTLLLSFAYFLFGVNEITPLVLNIIFATGLLVLVYFILKSYKVPSFYNLVVLISIILFTPLPTLVFIGMEHILHIILVILFIYFAAKLISNFKHEKTPKLSSQEIFLLILAPLVTAVRYEGLVLLFIVCFLIFIHKRFFYSVILGLMGVLPIIIYGLISISKGWYFLPNSILLKERVSILPYLISHHQIELIPVEMQFLQLLCGYLIFIFVYVFLTHYIAKSKIKKEFLVMNIILIALAVINFLFAGVGWFYRYDAYLVALGIFVITLSLSAFKGFKFVIGKNKMDKRIIIKYSLVIVSLMLMIAFISAPLESRGFESLKSTSDAMNDRYLGHVYPAQFIAKYYNNSTVVVNDLGTVAFYTDAHILDIYGLGSKEPLYYLLEKGKYNKSEVNYWVEQKSGEIAILQPEWKVISERIPDSWSKVGEWDTPKDIAVFGDNVIGFYAVNSSKKEDLIKNLRDFSPNLPKNIIQK